MGSFKRLPVAAYILCRFRQVRVMAFMVTVRDEREEAEIMKYVGVHDVKYG